MPFRWTKKAALKIADFGYFTPCGTFRVCAGFSRDLQIQGPISDEFYESNQSSNYLFFIIQFSYNLGTNIFQTLHQIHNTIFEASKLNPQHINRPRIIILIKSLLGEITTLHIRRRQLLLILGKVLADDIRNLLIAEIARGDEETLVGRFGDFNGFDVCESKVPDVDPEKGAGVGDLFFVFAGY